MTNPVTPDPAGLLLLAERVEAASYLERELMCVAFKAVFPEVSAGVLDAIDAWDAGYDRFCAMLDVGAFESAAMMLVPASVNGLRVDWTVNRAVVRMGLRGNPEMPEAWAKWLSLAIAAAALRARAAQSPASVGGEG